jgi:S1-C subfamily serine protease
VILALVAALVTGVLVGRASSPSENEAPVAATPAPTAPALAPTDVAGVAAAVAPAVVQLESDVGLGSGVIYHSDGLILTAAHVIDGVDTVRVRLADGRLFEGDVVGIHTVTDVGVVSIKATGLPVAVLGYDTPTRVGETAVALGSPFGFDQTVTAGIVSATGRTVNGVPMVQTDAAINPGNSGGPLVNAAGQVIGINDIIFTQGGGNDGIGFAIAIEVAIVVADQLVAGVDVQLAALGTATIPDTTGAGGAIVRETVPGSPAEAAGLEVGDRIITVDGERITDPGDLFAAVVSHRPGTAVDVEFVRDNTTRLVRVVLGGIEL